MKTLLIVITACLLVSGCRIEESIPEKDGILSSVRDVIEAHKQKVVSIRSKSGKGIGSGVLFTRQRSGSRDQYIIVTNNHVLQGVKYFEVILYGEAEQDNCRIDSSRIELYGKDALTDLAVIRLIDEPCNKKYEAFRLDETYLEGPRTGDFVLAIGAPLSWEGTATFGMVSATNRIWENYLARFIQTDAPINPGNSGGPLIDMKGNLIGINTLIDFDSRGRDGLGFALEWKFVQPLVKHLIDEGNIPRVDLGIRLKEATDSCYRILYFEHQDLRGDESGCFGPEVSTGIGELKPGDMIVSVNGKRVYKNIDYWVEASLVTSSIDKAEISYIAEEDLKPGTPLPIKNIEVPSKSGFSIPVEYLPRIIDTMMGVMYLGEKLSFREVRRGCSAIGETEPCGVRIENHSHGDIFHPFYDLFNMNIALIIKAKIDTLSSFINFIEDYKKTITGAKKQVQNVESKLNNCKENYKKIEDYNFSEKVKLTCEEWQDEFETSNQKLEQLHNLSIEVRDGDGKFSTHEFLWDPGLYIVRNIKTPG